MHRVIVTDSTGAVYCGEPTEVAAERVGPPTAPWPGFAVPATTLELTQPVGPIVFNVRHVVSVQLVEA